MNMEIWDKNEKKKEMLLIKETVELLKIFKQNNMHKFGDPALLDQYLRSIFKSFCQKYEPIYKMVLTTDDLTLLDEMITSILDVCDGKENFENAKKLYGERLAEKYVYPHVDKKKRKGHKKDN